MGEECASVNNPRIKELRYYSRNHATKMNKLLTTIILLAFLLLLMDIYFCESSQEATVTSGFLDGGDDPDSQNIYF